MNAIYVLTSKVSLKAEFGIIVYCCVKFFRQKDWEG